ncbi:cyclopropane fatty acyl phospholipid synthase [Desulfofustis glycolicus]|uniref:Cyclopropane-fatty-acyl-phospholipid synthase n=1 Tax=Desulfofustis glycolicus DSM 9705 TaxID=1121409 RepID=A0A1M5VL62_9BACT|nr:cyclopropane fatty acyl phospholipid synthase [Desulfofustis glycolicus]SHH75992.1 cyclopropane-fatty-acyl-phospholipid synthase [Desulfofustis glycolicus DSM 9705]
MRKIFRNVAESYLGRMLQQADIAINGERPWDVTVCDPRFFETVFAGGSLALGESYMRGWWECQALNQFFFRLLQQGLDRSCCRKIPELFAKARALLLNRQSRRRAFQIGERHYDAGNDLFELMLDDHMTYSCGYWRNAETLDQAQEAKLDLICRKLNLQPGMRLLDIGCGWGSLVLYAARHYGVEAVGLTVSEEQAQFARKRCEGLPVDIRLQDYRDLDGTFDAIASVGMFEHVGYKNYRTFMDVAERSLRPGGLFLLHTIGSNKSVHTCDPWFDKYIFPNGMLPSIRQIGRAIESRFIMEDWQNLGVDYEKTVLSWYNNFEKNWERLGQKYGEPFYRMWRYYLLSIAGGFRARYIQVWQIVLAPQGNAAGYQSVRCPHCLD